jgi:hypothetical protein
VVNQMLHGQCDATLPSSLASNLQRSTFTDSGKSYCLLMETELDTNGQYPQYVAKGWGTFIVYNRPKPERAISHQVPHPIFETGTEQQAIGLFKSTAAHSFLMCGAHRHANGKSGSCQQGTTTEEYGKADCAHNNANMFTMANLELDTFYGSSDWTAIQWHGLGEDSCVNPVDIDVFMSQGIDDAPGIDSKLYLLEQLITADQPRWVVRDPGNGVCVYDGTNNVQGRILNGVPYSSACTTPATTAVGNTFIHIEQKPWSRKATAWEQAVLDTW